MRAGALGAEIRLSGKLPSAKSKKLAFCARLYVKNRRQRQKLLIERNQELKQNPEQLE